MPEYPEAESERLSEAIHDELGREAGWLIKAIALSTSIFAALAAVAALQAGSTVNRALVLKTDATRIQAEASDQWAYYQAKGIKAVALESASAAWRAAGKQPPAEYATREARYLQEQSEIQARARGMEHERDAHSEEAEHLLHRHHAFANAVALFQVGIALGAVAALLRSRMVWLGSVALGLAGAAMFLTRLRG